MYTIIIRLSQYRLVWHSLFYYWWACIFRKDNQLAKCDDTKTIKKLDLKLFDKQKSAKSAKTAKGKKRNQALMEKKAEEIEELIDILEDLKERDEQ